VKAAQDQARQMFGTGYRTDLNLVFCQPDGDYIRPDTVTKAVRRLAKKAGFSGVSLHTLRHSHGSQLLSAGVPLPAVSKRLGHSNIYVTATVYAHALPSDGTRRSRKMGKGDEPRREFQGSRNAPPEETCVKLSELCFCRRIPKAHT
jgi:integrase